MLQRLARRATADRSHERTASQDLARLHHWQSELHRRGPLHVLGHGAVLIGMGERTTPMAVEILSRALFASGQARIVIAIELPASRAMMHLDTVMTMIDRATFVMYPYLDGTCGPGR